MDRWWLLFVLNLPILQEVIRKYFIPNDFVFFAADILVILTVIALFLRGQLYNQRLPTLFWILSAIFITWTVGAHILQGRHIGLYGIGLRATFLPVMYMLVASSYITYTPKSINRIFLCVNFWILTAGCMAFLQLALGKGHWINSVWGNTGLGIGDYGSREKGILLAGLFRPTSIFTHTGKFGQAIYTLVLFKWCFLSFCGEKKSKIFYLLVFFDLAAIFASGQRGAVVFLIFSAILILFFYARMPRTRISMFVFLILILGLGILAGAIANPKVASAIFDRFYSAVDSAPERLIGNFILPIKTMLTDYLIFGEGLGFFTFGGRTFGGTLVYKYIKMDGLGESSLIRFCGEVGVVCALIMILAFASLVVKGYRQFKTNMNTPFGASAIFYVIWVISLVAWSNTADIFANSVTTTLGYSLAGSVLAYIQLKQHSDSTAVDNHMT